MCGIWLAKNDFDNEVRTLQLLGRIPYCLIINLVSSRKQPCGAANYGRGNLPSEGAGGGIPPA